MPRNKRCPRCRGSSLEVHYYHGEELDLCRQCGGLWFEEDEVNQIAAAKDPHTDRFDYFRNLGAKQRVTDRPCPDCGRRLKTHHLLEDYHLEIDVCRGCRGAWIEAEQVSRVARSSKIRDALERMNRGTDWRTWMFQFLSRMPVEYNMRPRRPPWVTVALIALNVQVFLFYGFVPGGAWDAATTFGLTPSMVVQGAALWTFLTSIFLHGGLFHLVTNMYFLWVVGSNLEDALRPKAFLGLYLACGVVAGMASVVFRLAVGGDLAHTPSVGASGAIAGLFGMYALWFPNASFTFMFFVVQKKLAVYWYFGLWLLLQLVAPLAGSEGIDYAAHVGGFVVGLGLGAALRTRVWSANPLLAYLSGPEVRIRNRWGSERRAGHRARAGPVRSGRTSSNPSHPEPHDEGP